jgi:hypothetical protein
MDVSRIKQLYELADEGDWDSQRPLLADDYHHHVVGQGIDFNSADETIDAMKGIWQSLDMRWSSDRIEEHGVFAVSFSTGQIGDAEPFKALNIYRFDGDLIAEGWVIAPPTG